MSDDEQHNQTFEQVCSLIYRPSSSLLIFRCQCHRPVQVPRSPSPCNVLLFAKTVTLSSRVRHSPNIYVLWMTISVVWYHQAVPAKLLKCRPPRPESTDMPRFTLLPLMYVLPASALDFSSPDITLLRSSPAKNWYALVNPLKLYDLTYPK